MDNTQAIFGAGRPRNPQEYHMHRLLSMMHDNLHQSSQLHQNFLQLQAKNLEVIASGVGISPPVTTEVTNRLPLINKSQLREFGTGSIARCFGPAYAILDQRKSPRIPNGDLLMIDRVMKISAQRGHFDSPASIITEFDIPGDAWFIKENEYPGLPLGVLLEIALQPCGILSAYIGTSLMLPAEVNLFRNLDGKIRFVTLHQLTGKTVCTHAELLSSVSAGGMNIQNYSFELSCNGITIANGESSFGYFNPAVMDKQTGLDMAEKMQPHSGSLPSLDGLRDKHIIPLPEKSNTFSKPHLDMLDRLEFDDKRGKFGLGIIKGEKKLDGREWFYENHFFQDPVMPGSLGLETIIQGLWAYLKNSHITAMTQNPAILFSHKEPLSWKYRGQVIPANEMIYFEAHIKEKTILDRRLNLTCDADFWVDGIRIYAFQEISLDMEEGKRV